MNYIHLVTVYDSTTLWKSHCSELGFLKWGPRPPLGATEWLLRATCGGLH